MAKNNTRKNYEELVQEVYQAILDYENKECGYQKIEVKHNVKLKGKSGVLHQIDVYWAFTLGGVKYETLVEAKDWKNQVKMEQINSFKSELDDIPGFPKGVYVSRSGFQSGAITTAEHHGIKLCVLDSEKPTINIFIKETTTFYDSLLISINEEWSKQNKLSDNDLERLCYNITQESAVLLDPNKAYVQLYKLMCEDATPFYNEKDNIRHTVEKKLYGDWFLMTNDIAIPKVKIEKYEFQCYNKSIRTKIEVTVPQYIIIDILNKQKHLYNAATKEVELNISEDNLANIKTAF
ncbi:MAG: restriction endonuclease [Oscillospiraceae bacterium]|nr:restriction endonuclease [Oscillospiraceae bacterium]